MPVLSVLRLYLTDPKTVALIGMPGSEQPSGVIADFGNEQRLVPQKVSTKICTCCQEMVPSSGASWSPW